MIPLSILILIGSSLSPAAKAAGPSVKPLGAYPLAPPGLTGSGDEAPKVLLWCDGAKLVGVFVPEPAREKAGAPAARRPAPTAFLLHDGRCEADGSRISFGFLLPMKSWVFESAARAPLEEHTAWLLDRFEGSLEAGHLRGTLVQVDVGHPGLAFRETKVDAEALADEQTAFTDPGEWLGRLGRLFSLATGAP